MIGFAYSLIPVGFRVILMLFLSFVSQKTYPREFLRPEVILSRSYLRKYGIWRPPSIIINLSFFKDVITLNRLELDANIFRIFISLWYLPLAKISKKFRMLEWNALDDLTWNYPMKHLFLLATVTMITVKISFAHFHSSSFQENIFLY